MIQQQNLAESEPFFSTQLYQSNTTLHVLYIYKWVYLHKHVNICKYLCNICKICLVDEQKIHTVIFCIVS